MDDSRGRVIKRKQMGCSGSLHVMNIINRQDNTAVVQGMQDGVDDCRRVDRYKKELPRWPW